MPEPDETPEPIETAGDRLVGRVVADRYRIENVVSSGANTVIVYGQQEFYVSSQDSVVSGVTKQYYRLRGQRDLTIGSKTETTSWGGVKNLYR